MKKEYCYTVTKLDQHISKAVAPYAGDTWTPQFIATLRGSYDAANGFDAEGENTNPMWADAFSDTFDEKEIFSKVAALTAHRSKMKAQQQERFKELSQNSSQFWDKVSQFYGDDMSKFDSRVGQLSFYFVQAVDNYIEQAKERGQFLTRQEVIDGVMKVNPETNEPILDNNGNPKWDINANIILNHCFNQFLYDYNLLYNSAKNEARANYVYGEFEKMFNPDVWAAMAIKAKYYLRKLEGLNIDFISSQTSEATIDTFNDNDLASLFDPEQTTKEGWMTMTEAISAYGSLPTAVRRAISTHPKQDSKGNTVKDDLGYPIRYQSFEVYKTLKDIFRGAKSKKAMLRRLKDSGMYKTLYDELSYNAELMTQFKNAFHKNFMKYGQLKYATKKIMLAILNKTQSEKNVQSYLFQVKYRPMFPGLVFSDSRFDRWKEGDRKKLETLLEVFKTKTNPNTGNQENAFWKLEAEDKINHLNNTLNNLGIFFTREDYEKVVTRPEVLKTVIENLGNLAKYDLPKSDLGNFYDWLTKKGTGDKVGPVEQKLSKVISAITEVTANALYENKCRTINAKGDSITLYGDIQPSFMGDLLEKINFFGVDPTSETDKEQATAEFKKFLIDNYLKSSQFCTEWEETYENGKKIVVPKVSAITNRWIRQLYQEALDGTMFEPDSLTRQIQQIRVVTGKKQGVIFPFEDFTDQHHFEQMVATFFSDDTLKNQTVSKFVYVPIFVLGDSGVCKAMKVTRIGSFYSYKDNNGKFDVKPVVDELYQIYLSELQRQSLFKRYLEQCEKEGYEPNENIKSHASSFTMLTFLNKPEIKSRLAEMSDTEIKSYIESQLQELFKKFLQAGESSQALTKNNVEEYINSNFAEIQTIKQGKESLKISLEERLKEFYYNTYLSNLLQYQFFTGDLGYYKNVKDFQKRYKEIHAPGDVLDVEALDTYKAYPDGKKGYDRVSDGIERVQYFKEVKVNTELDNPEFMKVVLRTHATEEAKSTENGVSEVEKAISEGVLVPKQNETEEKQRQKKLEKLLGDNYKIYKDFTEVSRTDGQGHRSLTAFRKVCIMRGIWNTTYEGLYRKLKEFEKKDSLDESDIKTVIAFKAIIQCLKPFLFTKEAIPIKDNSGNVVNTLFVGVQHKYAEDILIPCLLPKGSKLRELAQYMEDNNIDVVLADSAVKVGAWGQVDIDSNEDTIGNILSKAKVHELNYEDYRIQSNVPAHINVERALGTQVRKLVLGNIDVFSGKEYSYLKGLGIESLKLTNNEKVPLTGRNLVSLYTSLIVANMLDSFKKFSSTVGDPQKLSNLLSSAILNNDRYALRKLLDIAVSEQDGNKNFNTPLYEGSIAHDTQGLIFSLFRKIVNKQDMLGGSLVQVSDWGINVKEEVGGEVKERPLKFVTDESGTNVLYAEVEIPFDFFYKDSFGQKHPLSFTDYCNSDGTFKLTEEGKVKLEEDYPGILDLIAYRIPSERSYSMINCKVVRCTEPTAGGTIRVPAQGTTIAGFDFDIDKLYLIRKEIVKKREVIEAKYSNSEKYKIFAKVYSIDAARHRRKEAEETNRTITENNRNIKEQIENLGQELNSYYCIEDAFETLLGISESGYTNSYDNLDDNDKQYLETQSIISGEELVSFMQDWNDFYSEDKINQIDESKVYKGNDVFHILFDDFQDKTSKKGWKLFNRIRDVESVTLAEENEDYLPKDSIINRLNKIREASKEYTIIKGKGGKSYIKYDHPLAHYWNKMLELNPEMQEDAAYDKARLFEEAAKELGLWKENTINEYLDQYDPNKLVSENSRAQRNNILLEIMRQRLMDPETLRDRITPGGFKNSIKSANTLIHLLEDPNIKVNDRGSINLSEIEKLPEYERADEDAADPNVLIYYNQLNQVAAKLIGVFANQNTNHQLSSLLKQLYINTPIVFDGMKGAKLLRDNGSGSEASLGKTLLAKEVKLNDGKVVDIDLNLAEFLAAAVDAVKSPVLNYLNFNTLTAASGALLARLGYSTTDIGILFNQPIIKELCAIINNSNGTVSFNEAKKRLLQKYTGKRKFKQHISTEDVTSEDLAVQLVKHRNLTSKLGFNQATSEMLENSRFRDLQEAALYLFDQAHDSAKSLSNYINSTKFTAANAVGSTAGFFYNQQQKIEDYINSPTDQLTIVLYDHIKDANANRSIDPSDKHGLIQDVNKYINSQKENPLAFEQCMYDLNKELMRVLEKYYPYSTPPFEGRRDCLYKVASSFKGVDGKTLDYCHNDTMTQLLCMTNSIFNPSKNTVSEEFSNRDFFLYEFPLRLAQDKVNNLYPELLQYLTFTYRNNDGEASSSQQVSLDIRLDFEAESENTNRFIDVWAQYAKGTQEQKALAVGLYMHNFFKLGYNVGPFNFIEKAPLEVKQLLSVEDTPYLTFINRKNIGNLGSAANMDYYSNMEFAYMMALNHPENNSLVHRMPTLIPEEMADTYKGLFMEGSNVKREFTIDFSGTEGKRTVASYFLDGEPIWNKESETYSYKAKAVISRGNYYYVAVDTQGYYNNVLNNGDTVITYRRVPALGKKNTYSVFASTLNEAIAIAERDEANRNRIEKSFIQDLQKKFTSDFVKAFEEAQKEQQVNVEESMQQQEEELDREEGEELSQNPEVQVDDADVDALIDKLQQCGEFDLRRLNNYLIDAFKDSSQELSDIFSNMFVSGTIDAKTFGLQRLGEKIKRDIKEGKREVYTSLTHEKIC